MTPEAVAFWVRAPGVGELRTATVPEPRDGEVLVRALRSGVSRGTETLVFRGEVPADQYARMRAPFQEGDFPGPVKYGYLSVGVVERGPAALEGRTVFSLYPHQSRYVVPASAVAPVPDDVPPAGGAGRDRRDRRQRPLGRAAAGRRPRDRRGGRHGRLLRRPGGGGHTGVG